MFTHLLILGIILQALPTSSPVAATVTSHATVPAMKEGDIDPAALMKIRRIYVDSFGDDVISRELQSMVVSSLVSTKRFKVTENRERADAILKGVALEKSSQEIHAYGEGTSVAGASGGSHSELSGGSGSFSGASHGGFVAQHMGTSDSSINTETINEARIAVRLVNPDGDVLWTSTQGSKGAKYKSASADAADKCVKELLRDLDKLQSPRITPVPMTQTPTAEVTHK